MGSNHHPAAGYSRDWAKARFMEVEIPEKEAPLAVGQVGLLQPKQKRPLELDQVAAGDNTIALYNKAEGRFLRLHNTIMDSSAPVSSEFPAGWQYERFQIVPTGPYGGIKPGMVVALYNTHWHRFIRMHQTYMDASGVHPPHLANKAGFPAGWTYEQFTVVDAGYGNIALYLGNLQCLLELPSKDPIICISLLRDLALSRHSAIHNRFVSMRSGTAVGVSSPLAANALPTTPCGRTQNSEKES